MLHPGELLAARRRHLSFPVRARFREAFLHIPNPKTKRFARHQHAKVDDAIVVDVLWAVFGPLPPNALLLDCSPDAFRRRWDALCARLGLPHAQPDGITPGVLRGSGTTHLYRSRVPIMDIAWRGRWRQLRNLEYYLQEVGGAELLQTVGAPDLARIELLDSAADVLMQTVLVDGGRFNRPSALFG